jgi:hypothetical protein
MATYIGFKETTYQANSGHDILTVFDILEGAAEHEIHACYGQKYRLHVGIVEPKDEIRMILLLLLVKSGCHELTCHAHFTH